MKGDIKKAVINRLRRIAGQIRAIEKMIEEDEQDQKKVLMQLSAATSSLANTKIVLVEEYTKEKLLAAIEDLSDLLK